MTNFSRMKNANCKKPDGFIAVTVAIMIIIALSVIITRPNTEDSVLQSTPVTAESSQEEGNDGSALLPDESAQSTPKETEALYNAPKGSIWIDTSAEALREAEESAAIQTLKADYSADRVYGGVDAVIHFSANGKDYALYHALDNYSGCFVLSTVGIEPYPYNNFGGEDDDEAMAFYEAEDAAREAYLTSVQSEVHSND